MRAGEDSSYFMTAQFAMKSETIRVIRATISLRRGVLDRSRPALQATTAFAYALFRITGTVGTCKQADLVNHDLHCEVLEARKLPQPPPILLIFSLDVGNPKADTWRRKVKK